MLGMKRNLGRLGKRSADDSQVSVLLKDFNDADHLLAKIIESTKSWRDAWINIAAYQSRMVDEFDGLYAPIVGSTNNPSPHKPVETDRAILARTNKLRREYDDMRTDMAEELKAVEERMATPAATAKESLSPMKKTIKKRDETKLDFERCQSRVDNYLKKPKRSDRDNASLAKAETDLATAKAVYQAADEDLRQRLPPLISLTYSLMPFILTAQVEIQNRMLGHYYTVLLTYCEEEGLPTPPPPMEHIVGEWEQACTPAQQQIESFSCLAHGKSIRQSMPANEDDKSRGLSMNMLKNRSNGKKSPAPPPEPFTKPRMASPSPPASILTRPGTLSVGSSSAATSPLPTDAGDEVPPPKPPRPPKPSPQLLSPQPTPQPGVMQFSPAGPNKDYFSYERHGSTASSTPNQSDVMMNIAAKKKKPPPPPPAKRRPAMTVTALYDFDGQGPDDLVFREGDQIRVVRRTNSTDDWWEGELRGRLGAFPANYVE